MTTKISHDAAYALTHGSRDFKRGNTLVTGEPGARIMYLHRSRIATATRDGIRITTAGWDTVTTKSRLNALEGVNVYTRKGQLFLNGEKWDGHWTLIAH